MDITDQMIPDLVIDDFYKLFMVENVKSYELVGYNTHRLTFRDAKVETVQHYLVVDLLHHDAFGHWVYESAVYLPLFRILKARHFTTLKLLLKAPRRYKTLFLQHFSIAEGDVCYELGPGNACLFPSPVTAQNDVQLCNALYEKLIENFMLEFQGEEGPRAYDYVVFPRQTLENYKPNDRTYDMTEVYASLVGTRYAVVNTDDEHQLRDQIAAVRSAPNVVVTDGSPLLVNLMFGANQCFYVVGNITNNTNYPKLKTIIQTACRLNRNTLVYLPQ